MIEALIHIANLLILASFLVRDILWLRVLSIVAGAAFIGYFGLQAAPLWEPVAWNGVFIVINVVQIVRLLRERRPVFLSADEERLRQLVFRTLKPRELQELMALGRWVDGAVGARLCAQGQAVDALIVLIEGRAEVWVGATRIAELQPGTFIGEIGFLTGEVASAEVRLTEPARYVAWPRDALKARMRDRPDLHAALQFVLGADMARKLRGAPRSS